MASAEGEGSERSTVVERAARAAKVYTRKAAAKASQYTEAATDAAARAATEAVSTAADAANARVQNNLPALHAAQDRYRAAESAAVRGVGRTVRLLQENPVVSSCASVPVFVLATPSLRRVLWVRLRGADGTVRGAERELAYLKQSVDEHAKEADKLIERSQLAEQEMLKGREKLLAAAHELRQLSKRTKDKEARLSSLGARLRAVRSPDSLALQRDAASCAADASKQRYNVDKRVRRLTRYVPI